MKQQKRRTTSGYGIRNHHRLSSFKDSPNPKNKERRKKTDIWDTKPETLYNEFLTLKKQIPKEKAIYRAKPFSSKTFKLGFLSVK